MKKIPRIYEVMLKNHLAKYRQMAFVTGPRQVGKTTICKGLADVYLSWDKDEDRLTLLKGPAELAHVAGLDKAGKKKTVVLDEIHKNRGFKNYLKGLFDTYEDRARFVITGSSRLDVYRKGGDSLMGRYFMFRMHPLSVAELIRPEPPAKVISRPAKISPAVFSQLLEAGGFPEPFINDSSTFSVRWQAMRQQQLMKEEIRDLTQIHETAALEHLVILLKQASAGQLIYNNLARDIRVSMLTVQKWVATLANLHFGFLVRPWHEHVRQSLRKEPKWYLRDWAGIKDKGARNETLVACHLLKAVEAWTDLGLGAFELFYLRDKQKREVDFLVVKDSKPWLLVEVKSSDARLSPELAHFQAQIKAAHAVQLDMSADFEEVDEIGRAHV
jgi:uncharacterized protein